LKNPSGKENNYFRIGTEVVETPKREKKLARIAGRG